MNSFSEIASDSLQYSYKRSFNGFVVKLTEEELKQLEGGLQDLTFLHKLYVYHDSNKLTAISLFLFFLSFRNG